MLRRKRPSIAMEIVQDYVLHVPVAVKEHVKVVKAVVKMDVKQHVVADVEMVARGVANRLVKTIA